MPDFILLVHARKMSCELSTRHTRAWNKRAGASVLISEDVEWRTQASNVNYEQGPYTLATVDSSLA
jgi:hypothetical protein